MKYCKYASCNLNVFYWWTLLVGENILECLSHLPLCNICDEDVVYCEGVLHSEKNCIHAKKIFVGQMSCKTCHFYTYSSESFHGDFSLKKKKVRDKIFIFKNKMACIRKLCCQE